MLDQFEVKFRLRGFALPLVMIASLVVLALIWIVLQSRQTEQQVQGEKQSREKFNNRVERLRNILETVNLCTCNLRGLKTNNMGPSGREIVITPESNQKKEFGYYPLETLEATTSCATDALEEKDTVVKIKSVEETDHSKEYLVGSSLKIFRFEDLNYSVNDPITFEKLDRYKAKWIITGKSGSGRTHSNLQSPEELDLYIEVATEASGEMIIQKCFSKGSSPKKYEPPPPEPPGFVASPDCGWTLYYTGDVGETWDPLGFPIPSGYWRMVGKGDLHNMRRLGGAGPNPPCNSSPYCFAPGFVCAWPKPPKIEYYVCSLKNCNSGSGPADPGGGGGEGETQ